MLTHSVDSVDSVTYTCPLDCSLIFFFFFGFLSPVYPHEALSGTLLVPVTPKFVKRLRYGKVEQERATNVERLLPTVFFRRAFFFMIGLPYFLRLRHR